MKRVQEGEYASFSSAGQEVKLDPGPSPTPEKPDDGNLRALPNDEYGKVLGYLGPEDKKNLKLASRVCERRVMALDPAMRRWKINFVDADYQETVFTLMKAKTRHILNENIQDIQLSVDFKINHGQLKLTCCHLLAADSVINHWKNNIVDLSIPISGYEFFLLDPELRLPQLKSLALTNEFGIPEGFTVVPEKDKSTIISTLLQKHADTLESLRLDRINVTISENLKVKKLSAQNVYSGTIISLLKSSQKTLQSFDWSLTLKHIVTDFPNSFCPQLQLKEFSSLGIGVNCTSSIIKFSQSTLTVLKMKSPDVSKLNIDKLDQSFQLGLTPLKLKTFSAVNVPSSIVTKVLSASHSTLEELHFRNFRESECDEIYDRFFNGLPNLKLERFEARSISMRLAAYVMRSAHTTLKNLDINFLREDTLDWNKLMGSVQLHIKSFKACDVIPEFIAAVINASFLSLLELEIIDRFDYDFSTFTLGSNRLQLNKFKCFNFVPAKVLYSVIRSAYLSLKELELTHLIRVDDFNMDLEMPKLKKFKGKNINFKIVFEILKSSHLSLEELRLDNIEVKGIEYFNLEPRRLQLKKFEGVDIPARVVSTVLQSVQPSMNLLVLKNLSIEGEEQFGPLLNKLLTQFRIENPFCLIDV